MNFDLDGARKAGFSDQQIVDGLANKAGFDAAGARAAGFTDDAILAKLMSVPSMPGAPQAAAPARESPGTAKAALIATGRTFDRIGKGVRQVWYGATGNEKAQQDLAAVAADDDRVYSTLQKQHPIATAVGESIPSMVIPIGGTVTTLGTIGKLAAASAIPAAAEYGTAGERITKAAGAATGAVVGGSVAPKLVGAGFNAGKSLLKGMAGKVTPDAVKLAARAEELGIKVNAAQLGDSKFVKTLASALDQMPFTGAAKATSDQRAAYTRAVSKTFGDDVDKITPAVYNTNRARLGAEFDDLAMRNTLNVDDALMSRLDSILSEARQMGSDDTIRAVDSTINRILKQSNASADMTGGKVGAKTVLEVPGAAYMSIDSMLGKSIKGGGEKSIYLKDTRNAIRDAMDRSITPTDKAAWDTARLQYKNLKAVRDIVARDNSGGNIPPSQLTSALNNSEAGKEAMAMGSRGTLGELAHIGQRFVKDTVPNSGTAQRAVAMGLIGGGGFAFGASPIEVAGMLAGGATAGRLVNKILQSPKVITSLSEQGLTVKDLLKLPPEKITQIIGGMSGMSVMNQGE